MAEQLEQDREDQENEVLVLASIFEDEDTFMVLEDNSGGSFYASVQLPSVCCLKLGGQMVQQARALGATLQEGADNSWLLPVMSLPPIELNFQYPHDYPSKNPPRFTLSSKWLSVQQLNILCNKLDEIWVNNANEVVIFPWTEFLKNETLDCLKIASPIVLDTSGLPRTLRQRSQLEALAGQPGQPGGAGGDNETQTRGATGGVGFPSHLPVWDASTPLIRAVQDIAALTHLIPPILAHDRQMRERLFDTSHNTCGVCFEDKFGRDCIRFSGCGHIYCKACMREHFQLKITEGDVKGLLCPENGCETQAHATQIKELVEPELYKKYDARLLDMSLSEMADIVFCPRTSCQSPVLREQNENMGICPACRFAFCIICKMTYHGVAPCKVTKEQVVKIKDDYESATDMEKALLEQRYGKRMIRQVIDDCNSEEWIRAHSKRCPNCDRPIQKFDGCNKMTCMKCRCYFCWLCFHILPRSDPYSHYRGDGTCASRLFEGVLDDGGGDGDDEEEEEGDVHGNRPMQVVNIENWWQYL